MHANNYYDGKAIINILLCAKKVLSMFSIMKWSNVPPDEFEWGGTATPECCWVKPNIWGDDEPTLGELERHIYPDADGEHGVLINTMNGSIDVKEDSIGRMYCKVPKPPVDGWTNIPPKSVGWYWARSADGDIDLVQVYLAENEGILVFTGIDWPSFRVAPVTTENLSWLQIPVPE